ncbi:MAG: BatD family protein [Planctomycetota bacterium]
MLLVWLCASPGLAAQGSAPAVETRLNRSQIYQGESVRYSAEIQNVESPRDPDLSRFNAFDVQFLGRSQNSSSFTLMINGRRVSEGSSGVIFNYLLTPKEPGDLIVPSPVFEVDGKPLTGETHSLKVIRPKKQDLVLFHMRVERQGEYPLQPFTVNLLIFVKKLPAPYDSQDPLAYLQLPLELRVPWTDVPEGLLSEDLSDWLSPLRARGRGREAPYGFGINDLTFQTNSLFGRARSAVFDLGGRPARTEDVAGFSELEGKSDGYFVYQLRREFTPDRAGRFPFGAVSVKGAVITGVQETNPITEDVFDVGGGAVVEVKDAPEEDRPASYAGAFGSDFRLEARVAPRRARVGDPLTVTLTLTGKGNLAQAGPPPLREDEQVTSLFKVEKPTADQDSSRAIFTFSIRPLTDEVTEVPAVPYSYFDLERSRYVTIHSEPMAIEVDRIENLSTGDIVRGDLNGRWGGEFTRAEGLFGNITDPTEVRDDGVSLRLLAGYLAGLFALCGACALVVSRRRRLHGDPIRVRRRQAARRARERMAGALASLREGGGFEAAEAFRSTFGGLVADAVGIPEAGLTAREMDEHLERMQIGAELREQVARLLAECDGLRYGGGGSAPEEKSGRLLEQLITELQKKGRLK